MAARVSKKKEKVREKIGGRFYRGIAWARGKNFKRNRRILWSPDRFITCSCSSRSPSEGRG
jgi:hypothetical protein